MSAAVFNILCLLAIIGVMAGLAMLSKVKTAAKGNLVSAASVLFAILLVMFYYGLLDQIWLWLCLAAGSALGLLIAFKVKMIQMPQLVALLCSFGGASCSIVVGIALLERHTASLFDQATAAISLAIGVVSMVGALIAAGKLHGKINQRPVVFPAHSLWLMLALAATLIFTAILGFFDSNADLFCWLLAAVSALFGFIFVIRVGGADMPITISFLISIGSVAGAVAGMAVGQMLLVALEGIVGASGLLLTQIMCRAMNRKLSAILLGRTSVAQPRAAAVSGAADLSAIAAAADQQSAPSAAGSLPDAAAETDADAADILLKARDVIIIPGYGMALAQAQGLVKEVADRLEAQGARVRFAIHPVAGRMPGHMNVLLCEVDIPYDQLYELEAINDDFAESDLVIVVGANDVINPAAREAEGTPIYGMPVLNADQAERVIICNYDDKPGYSGVPNPIYTARNTIMKLGDAKETLQELIASLA